MHCSTTRLGADLTQIAEIKSFLNERQSLVSPEEDPRPPKRRRVVKHASFQDLPADGGHEYLTLAKADLVLVFSDISTELSPTLDHVTNAAAVRLEGISSTPSQDAGHSKSTISISTVDWAKRLECTLQGSIEDDALQVIRHAIYLNCRSWNVDTRSTFRLSESPQYSTRSGEQQEQSDVSMSSFQLTVRILIPNATSLLSGSGLPRTPDLRYLFPSKTQSEAPQWSPRDFYDHAHVPDVRSNSSLPTIHELQCHLYPFQRRAVRWMLEREGFFGTSSRNQDAELPHGFIWETDADGRRCLTSRLLGLASSSDDILAEPRGRTGSILAEEMGLGKTVEVIALVCSHRMETKVRDGDHEYEKSPATLIITPPAILQQWKDELRTLAPSLSVVTYDGMSVEGLHHDDADIKAKCLINDVVLTTYPVLARDIHHAEKTHKNLRHEKKYVKRLSPLTHIKFFRCVLDEAQMVESGVSNAAKVASLIPREHAWCVSGTPARNAKDLLGLLIFLKYEPYCSLPKLWDHLVPHHRDVLHNIFKTISLRHTKSQIKDEMQLPPQKRVVITLPFTGVEEQHYASLFQQMADECGLDLEGAPLQESWDPDDNQVIEKMRTWLARLRQTCLHPEVGSRNRRALGGSKGPLRTVAEVLEVMIEQNDTASRSEERELLLSRIRRGQILEHAEFAQDALDIWSECLKQVQANVSECRQQLNSELERAASSNLKDFTDTEQAASVTRSGIQRQRLRVALEMEHMCTFFVANAHFQLKVKEIGKQQDETLRSNVTHGNIADGSQLPNQELNLDAEQSMSDRAKELEVAEEFFYDKAKLLRQELLADSSKNADLQIMKVKDCSNDLTPLPTIRPLDNQSGIQSRKYSERVQALVSTLSDQTKQILTWRAKAIELLTLPLVDTEQEELKGDEYETSKRQQDEVYVYVDALRALVSDRHTLLTGQENTLIEHEMNFMLREAREGKGHSPQLLIALLRERHEIKPTRDQGSFKGLVTQLRQLKTEFRIEVEGSNNRAAAESMLINNMLQYLHQVSSAQNKLSAALDKEIELFKDTMNVRLDYYRQLQAISDTVAPFEEEMDNVVRNGVLASKIEAEGKMQDRIASMASKGRYLVHLRDEASNLNTSRTCIICTSPFENGILTSCGHTFCTDCLRLWWGQHRNCPTCKKHLRRNDFHPITYKPKELAMQQEGRSPAQDSGSSDEENSAIYSGVRSSILTEIKDIDLGGSFGTKIDTLARHLLWIRDNDPGAKSIIFSQYRDFLNVLERAFSQFKIGFASIDRKDGIQKFKTDPNVECFFLHAKAHSSGLNLVQATHVFLCEPLINTAIELQAISRVHRIGQHSESTVWMYLIEGTVEKSIYDISVQRRMDLIGQVKAPKVMKDEQGALEGQLEAANTLELEQNSISHLLSKGSSGGEWVQKEDLWNSLFASRPRSRGKASSQADRVVAGQLAADAAEMRGTERQRNDER